MNKDKTNLKSEAMSHKCLKEKETLNCHKDLEV